MKHQLSKAALAAVASGGLLAGCATTVDMGGPLGHYRYNYDARPVAEATVTVPAPAVTTYRERTVIEPTVTYREPAVTYREPVVTYREPALTYREPAVTYREPIVTYREPTVTYRESRIIYSDPAITYYEPAVLLGYNPSLPYKDHGQ
jgi:hypothetical protein